jgi:transketolase
MKELLRHESQRGWFAHELHGEMAKNKDIWVITADLGYGMLDNIRDYFPDRFVNTGAAEQGAVGVATGLALKGKIPFVYSITPFTLYRPYEWIRNYVNHENIPVKLVGAGRDQDYKVDGFTHWAEEAKPVLDTLPNVVQYWPETKEDVPDMLSDMIANGKPSFISLRRG